jgi:hypothetical protein
MHATFVALWLYFFSAAQKWAYRDTLDGSRENTALSEPRSSAHSLCGAGGSSFTEITKTHEKECKEKRGEKRSSIFHARNS